MYVRLDMCSEQSDTRQVNVARLQDRLLALRRQRIDITEQIAATERELDEALVAELRGGVTTSPVSATQAKKPRPSGRLDVYGELVQMFDKIAAGADMDFVEMQAAASIEIPIASLRACVARNSKGPKSLLERTTRGRYRKRLPRGSKEAAKKMA